ncbi:MAG: ArnT family glycosyltransferase [Fidelibacterota bacterium]
MLNKKKYLVYILFGGLLVRVFSAAFTDPGFDEAYYGVYSKFLSAGYFDHPPLVSLSAGIGLWLFNSFSSLALRFGAITLYLGSSLLLFSIAKMLYGRKSAIYSVILFHITPFFLVGIGAFVIPDNFLTLFWFFAIFTMVKYLKTRSNYWLLLWGTAIGFGFLAKYHIVLLIAGFGWSMLFHSNFRKLWRNPWLYGGFLLGLLIMMPNILWNYHNDWISYIYQFGKSSGGSSLSFTKFYQGILSQIGYLLPWNFAILVLGFRGINKQKWLLPIILFPIIIFTLFGFKQRILPHWPMPGYLTLLIPAGYYLSKQKWAAKYSLVSGGVTFLVLCFVVLQSQFGIVKMKPKHDFSLDGFGWKEMISRVEERDYFQEIDFLAGHKWFTAGEIMFAGKGKYPTIALHPKDPRGFAFWYDMKDFKGQNCLFISTNRYHKDPTKKYSEFFQTITPIDTIKIYRGEVVGKIFYLWKCETFNGDLIYPYGINHEKSNQ